MRRRILVIDDNTAFRGALGQVLDTDCFVVIAGAATGGSGVQLAREHKPDLVIVDVQLPDTDGFNVAEQLAGLDLTLDVILTSGLDSSDLGALVTDSSARGFIPKAELSAAAIEALLAPTALSHLPSRTGPSISATMRGVDDELPDPEQAPAPIRVALADDSVLLREGIASLLTDKGFEIVGQSGTADDLLLKVRSYNPDIAIVDIKMPPTHTDEGLRAAKEIREKYPDTAVLVLSQYVEEGYALELLQDEHRRRRLPPERQGLRPDRLRRRGQARGRGRLRA